MNDLISREELIKEVCGKCDGACDCCCEENCIQCKRPNMRCDFRKDLDDAPTVDAFPIVEGKLVHHILTDWRCNMCGRMHTLGDKNPEEAHMSCCSSCGAVFNTAAFLSVRRAVEDKNRRNDDA